MKNMIIIGNLGKDALVNNVNGKQVINFSVAVTEKYKDASGTQKEDTTWVECAKWGEQIGIAPYLKKGTKVFVSGTPSIRQYQTQDGKAGASLVLRVGTIELLGGAPAAAGAATTGAAVNSPADAAAPGGQPTTAENLPF